MSAMYMDMPRDTTPPAGIGHNSRDYEVKRAAEEIRAAYLKDNLREGTSNKWKVLHTANVSTMSDSAFRQLFTYLAFGNANCDNITVGHKRVAMLLDRSERTVQRIGKELEKEGWLSAEKRGRKEAVRTASIPEKMMKAIIFEVLDQTNLAGQATKVEVPNLSLHKEDRPNLADKNGVSSDLTRQNASNRPDKIDGITYIDKPSSFSLVVSAPENADPQELVDEDFVDYHTLFKAWSARPSDLLPRSDLTRKFTDDNLRGAVRGQAKHPLETVISAVRMTIMSMQTRVMLGDRGKYAAGGFGSYFQQELIGTIGLLLRPPADPPPNARGAPPESRPQWAIDRDEKRDKERQNKARYDEGMKKALEMLAKQQEQRK